MNLPIYYRRNSCRLCGSLDIDSLIKYRDTPPAEWFFKPELKHLTEVRFPLELFFCNQCFHVQLMDVLDPKTLFQNYFYTSSSSPGLHGHFGKYARHIVKFLNLSQNSFVVDVGSNDGTFMKHLQEQGMKVLGVEPSINLANNAKNSGLEVINDLLSLNCADEIVSKFGQADVVTANNVFAHSDNLEIMASAIKHMLRDSGVFVFEVSSLLDTIQGLVFDYVYHEHLSYHSMTSLLPFLKRMGFEVFRVENVPTKGGSMRVFAQKRALGKRQIEESVTNQLLRELDFGITKRETFISFWDMVNSAKTNLFDYLSLGVNQSGRRVIGYGASATTTTLIHEFNLSTHLDFVVDDNPVRFGCLVPGTTIMVKSPKSLDDLRSAHVLILAWRFADQIYDKCKEIGKSNDLTFIVPLPSLRVL